MSLVPRQVTHPDTHGPAIVTSLYAWEWDGQTWKLILSQPLSYREIETSITSKSSLMLAVPVLVQELLGKLGPAPPYRYVSLQVLTNSGWQQVLGHGNWMPRPSISI